MTESDLPQTEFCKAGTGETVGELCVASVAPSDCSAAGVNRIGAAPASSASSVGKYCSNSASAGAIVAVVSGVNAKGGKVSEIVVVCTMHAPVNNTIARQRHIIKGCCR